MSVVWLNGELADETAAMIPALDRGVLWGYGLFETMRAYGGRAWAFEEHLERLARGGELIALPVPGAQTVRAAVDEVLGANGLTDAGVRVTVTKGAGPPDPQSEATGSPNVLLTAWPLRDYTELYQQGVSLVTIPGGGRTLAGVKTTSYAVSVSGRVIAGRAGADDALFVGEGGRVLETTGSNLFCLFSDRLATPPLEDAILPGVTRRHVLDVAEACGYRTSEEPLTLKDLYSADEVLLTSSLREVYPVRSVDGRSVGRGDVAEQLRDAYRAAVLAAIS